MTNNDIFKKLRVALMLRDDQIVEILELVDFKISKGEIGNFFRTEDNPKYVECGDQVLRNFLNGLVIHLRGTKEAPKNPTEIIESNKKAVNAANTPEPFSEKKSFKPNSNTAPKPRTKTNAAGKSYVKKEKPIPVVEKVVYNNGKPKKK